MDHLENFKKIDSEMYSLFSKSNIIPKNTRISYGTSGFRFNNSCLDYITFRTGIFVVNLSILTYPLAIGVVITASHNPGEDNGVKIVYTDGGMLTIELEKVLEKFVNELNLEKAINELTEDLSKSGKHSSVSAQKSGVVMIGRDTRESSLRLSEALLSGISIRKIEVKNFEIAATPMIHFFTDSYNRRIKTNSEPQTVQELRERYFNGYGNKFKKIFSKLLGNSLTQKVKLTVDCSNGVGYQSCQKFFQNYMSEFFDLNFVNKDDVSKLNFECGAEFVQKERLLPSNVDVQTVKDCISFDGDADRLVYFRNIDSKLSIMDGDKQSALICLVVHKLMKTAYPDIVYSFGVVVTQYSNFALVNFLKSIGVKIVISPTGVKHTHSRAEQFDIGVYFEANGHGTLMIKEELLEKARKSDLENGESLAFNLLSFTNNVY